MSLSEQKRREIGVAIASFVALLVATVPVTSMMGAGWDAQGITYSMAWGLVSAIGVDIDLAVVLPVGIAVGWLLLFLLDTTKRIQAPILVLALPLFLGTLYVQGKWFGSVDWVGSSPVLLLGLLFGVAVGSYGRVVETARHMLFPTAARSLYGLLALACIVFFVDRVVFGTPSVVTVGIDLLASGAFVFVLNLFTQYESRRDVTLISTDRRVETDIVAGLFEVARQEYSGISTENAESLNSAIQVYSELVDTPAGFRYKHPDRIFASAVTVRTRGFDGDDIRHNEDLLRRRIDSLSDVESRVRRFLDDRLLDLLPQSLVSLTLDVTDQYPSPTERFVDSMIDTDVVILAASYDHLFDDGEPTDTAETFTEVCGWYENTSIDVLVVLTDGNRALEDYQEEEMRSVSLWDHQLSDFVRRKAGLIDCSTVKLTDTEAEEPIRLTGANEILLGL